MKASFVDLRKKSSQLIRALSRNETVTVYYRGRPAAIMRRLDAQRGPARSAASHPSFGLWANRQDLKDAAGRVRRIRRGRHDGV
jgi:antitoxin (DNA-binding transcriptional repressor) of toxin-antitoxin stability system